jgi:hypothetical protein
MKTRNIGKMKSEIEGKRQSIRNKREIEKKRDIM